MSRLRKTILRNLADVEKERFITNSLEFFKSTGFDDREKLIKALNKLKSGYVTRVLFAISFYQSLEGILANEKRLRPVLLLILIDGVEENAKTEDDFKTFFRRLDDGDKLYLLNNLKIKTSKNGYRKVYHSLMKKRGWADHDFDYQSIDRGLKHIDKFADMIAMHLYKIRCYVLHEFGVTMPFAFLDDSYGLTSVFAGYSTGKGKKRRWRSFYTQISEREFTNIVKRGVLKKIGI